MTCSDSRFRAIVGHLRTVCPPPKGCKLKVSRVAGLDASGYCAKHRRTFTIEVEADLTEYETEFVLIHEWAHMLMWRPYHPLSDDHDAEWGVWQARVYRKFYGIG